MTNMKVFLLPYKQGSQSCRAMAAALKAKRIRLQQSRFVPTMNTVVVNWGNSEEVVDSYNWINPPAQVAIAASKTASLTVFRDSDVPCVNLVRSIASALDLLDKGSTIVARYKDRGHGGDGIEIVNSRDELADLYGRRGGPALMTEYFKGREEYRIHVAWGEAFDFQQKKKREGMEVNYMVRNHDNGWVFCREGVEPPQCVVEAAIAAVTALGLDFGAVDIKFNEVTGACAVLEVNTAPGVEGTTLENYAEKLMELISKFGV